jgi:glycosyltransferase involved in cell wall biosynthesis
MFCGDLKIAIVSPTYGEVGGVARHVWYLTQKLKARGYKVDVFSTVNVFHIPAPGLKNVSFAIASIPKTLFKKFDVIHCHNLLSVIPSWFAIKRKVILTIHGVWLEQIEYLHWYGKAFFWLDFALTKTVDTVTSVSKRGARHYGGKWIPNAIEPSDLPTEKTKLKDPQVVYVGRPSKEKGIAALFTLPDDLKSSLVFVYGKPWRDTMKVLAGSDALILPSVMEGCPTVMLEAMALGVPVVVRRMSETIDLGGDDAYYFDRDDELPNLIRWVLDHKDEARMKAKRARERVLKSFTWDQVVEKYLEVYG